MGCFVPVGSLMTDVRVLRFSQEVLYHLHLPWSELALVLAVACGLEGFEDTGDGDSGSGEGDLGE